jgi:hypothetical protein
VIAQRSSQTLSARSSRVRDPFPHNAVETDQKIEKVRCQDFGDARNLVKMHPRLVTHNLTILKKNGHLTKSIGGVIYE